MQNVLKQIETQLQGAIERSSARLFSPLDVENKLAQRLIEAMQGKLITLPDGTHLAPHIFTMNVSSRFAADVRANQALLDSLCQVLLQSGNELGLTFEAMPTINIFPDENILEGEFNIQAMRSEPRPETASFNQEEELVKVEIPDKAFLIVGGSKIFSLDHPVINIGRKLDNQLVIDDPRVSRRHSQLRAVKGRYVIFDVGSSGGTFVNGERVSRAILRPGDVISLAGVPMVYGQDAVRAASETQEYKRPSQTFDDTTASLELSDLDLEDFTGS